MSLMPNACNDSRADLHGCNNGQLIHQGLQCNSHTPIQSDLLHTNLHCECQLARELQKFQTLTGGQLPAAFSCCIANVFTVENCGNAAMHCCCCFLPFCSLQTAQGHLLSHIQKTWFIMSNVNLEASDHCLSYVLWSIITLTV